MALAVAIPLLGGYMARVYGSDKAPGDRVFLPIERLIYRICRVDPDQEQRWTVYAFSVIAFSVVGLLILYAMQRLQASLPLNPTHAPQVGEALSFNTATSFTSNTNWQSYAGESTLSHLTQMVGLTVQNFVSAAAGMAVMAALIRGLARRRANTVGNFWVDLTRTTLRILLPIAFVGALIYVGTGVVQNFHGFEVVKTLEGNTQVIPGGPTASQEVIKMVATNGGGFFNVNSAHPFSNPNGFSDLFGLFLILVIPVALTYTYGKMVGEQRQGWVLLGVMVVIWALFVGFTTMFELNGNPKLDALKVNQASTSTLPGGNLEGKEVRFGTPASATWAASTTGTSNGSVNSMHDSFTPLGGMMPLLHMQLGEVSPGGVGVGLNGMLVLALLAVFIAGLMVGSHAGVPGQEDPGERGQARRAVHPRHAGRGARRYRDRDRDRERAQRLHLEPGSARLLRGAVRLHVGREQQRLRVRRADREHPVHEQRAGDRDAHRPVLPDHPDAGDRGLARPQGQGSGVGRHVPDRHAAVRRPALRRHHRRRRPHVLPRARARSHRRAARHLGGLRTMTMTPTLPPGETKAERVRATTSMLDPSIMRRAITDSFVKLNPRHMMRNPVMFVVEVGSVLTTILFFTNLSSASTNENVFAALVTVFLWFTVLFANFAEAVAEGRGKAQADTLRKTRSETMANRRRADGSIEEIPGTQLDLG